MKALYPLVKFYFSIRSTDGAVQIKCIEILKY